MRLAGGDERLLHADVELHVAGAEPGAAARAKRRRVRQLDHLEKADVEGARLLLAARRRGDLDVVEAENRHPPRSTIAPWRRSSRTPWYRATRGWRRRRPGAG